MIPNSYKFLSVDFQNDFTTEGGTHYQHRPSVGFVRQVLAPYLQEKGISIAEIVSDYRQPRPGRKGDFCKPGTEGYESAIPQSVNRSSTWVKAANSPLWTRENAGNKDEVPGIPFEDPESFGTWLKEAIGETDNVKIVVIGLTLDRCVLCTVQELYMRGYESLILEEATDPYSGDPAEKETMLNGTIINNWAKPVSWEVLKQELRQ